MKRQLLTILLIFSISVNNQAFAVTEAEQNVTIVEKNEPAPFRGYLFSEDKALKFRKDLLQLDTLKAMNDSYERSITLYKTNDELFNYKVNTLLQQNDKLADQLYRSKDRNDWENWAWFAFGILVTSVGVSVGLHNK
jgi:hypothetical protein